MKGLSYKCSADYDMDFLEHRQAASMVKATVVSEYFPQWGKLMTRGRVPRTLAFVNLFAGPGIYWDGGFDTPILLARNCFNDPLLRDRALLLFNDPLVGEKLREHFEAIFPPHTFAHLPDFSCRNIERDPDMESFLTLNTMAGPYNDRPTLLFIAPRRYRHINTRLLARFMTCWGNELFLFVRAHRLDGALQSLGKTSDLRTVLPHSYLDLRGKLKKLLKDGQSLCPLILSRLTTELQHELGSRLFCTTLQFCDEDFNGEEITPPSYYLIHFTRSEKSSQLARRIFGQYGPPANAEAVNAEAANAEAVNAEAVNAEAGSSSATYRYDPRRYKGSNMMDEFFSEAHIQRLKQQLTIRYKGQTLDAATLFRQQTAPLYAGRHYRLALRQLAGEGKIIVEYTDGQCLRSSVLLIPECKITFS